MCGFFIFRRLCRLLQGFYNYKNIINYKLQEYINNLRPNINILPTELLYMEPELKKIGIKFFVQVLIDSCSDHHHSILYITVHKFLNLIAIKNNFNIHGGSFVVSFKSRRRSYIRHSSKIRKFSFFFFYLIYLRELNAHFSHKF